MANAARGEIDLELDGCGPVTWRLRWKDIAEIESALAQIEGRKSTWWQFRARMQEWSIHDFALVLWAGLRHTGKFDRPENLLEVMDHTAMDNFMARFADIIMHAVPEELKKKLQATQEEKKASGQ